jgi:hypothetical protein
VKVLGRLILTENGFGLQCGRLFTNSSGHPDFSLCKKKLFLQQKKSFWDFVRIWPQMPKTFCPKRNLKVAFTDTSLICTYVCTYVETFEGTDARLSEISPFGEKNY